MRKKLGKLSVCCFALALLNFFIAFVFYHYFTPNGGFTFIFQHEVGKPFVSILFGVFGVQFLFSSVMSLIVRQIFYKE